MFIIKFSFEIDGVKYIRYAQNRSVTYDGSYMVSFLPKAKRFETIAKAQSWIKRNNLDKDFLTINHVPDSVFRKLTFIVEKL